MDDVLECYERPYDSEQPVICVDEKSKELRSTPRQASRDDRIDYEYRRHGTRNIFVACEPLAGWRDATVTARRTKLDFARYLRKLMKGRYKRARCVHLIVDNLNTHSAKAICEALKFEESPDWLKMSDRSLPWMRRTCPCPCPCPIPRENTMTQVFDHERLDVYQVAIEFVVAANSIVEHLPRGRSHLADQLHRASTSVPLNIAEGAGETSARERARFYRMARRSGTECAAILDICAKLELVPELGQARELLLRVVSMLIKLGKSHEHPGTGTGTGTGMGAAS